MTMKFISYWSFVVIMIVAYIRPDKQFDAAHEQLQLISSYALSNNMQIDDEFVDQTSQNKRLELRVDVVEYFRQHAGSTLLISDLWVLSTNMEDVIQMVSCLLKNNYTVHIIKQSVIISQQTNVMLALGLIDQLRQTIQQESTKAIGRPKGSRSSSKFDKYINEIMFYIKEKKSVSEMARLLSVSRSSLKDYIESRELKQVAFDLLVPKENTDAEEQVINTIKCPQSYEINEGKGNK